MPATNLFRVCQNNKNLKSYKHCRFFQAFSDCSKNEWKICKPKNIKNSRNVKIMKKIGSLFYRLKLNFALKIQSSKRWEISGFCLLSFCQNERFSFLSLNTFWKKCVMWTWSATGSAEYVRCGIGILSCCYTIQDFWIDIY